MILESLQTRRIRPRKPGSRSKYLILTRLLFAPGHRLPQTELADAIQLSVSQVQRTTSAMMVAELVKREITSGSATIILSSSGIDAARQEVAQRGKEFALLDVVMNNPNERDDVLKIVKNLIGKIEKELITQSSH